MLSRLSGRRWPSRNKASRINDTENMGVIRECCAVSITVMVILNKAVGIVTHPAFYLQADIRAEQHQFLGNKIL